MTIQDLINELQKVKDKSLPVTFGNCPHCFRPLDALRFRLEDRLGNPAVEDYPAIEVEAVPTKRKRRKP